MASSDKDKKKGNQKSKDEVVPGIFDLFEDTAIELFWHQQERLLEDSDLDEKDKNKLLRRANEIENSEDSAVEKLNLFLTEIQKVDEVLIVAAEAEIERALERGLPEYIKKGESSTAQMMGSMPLTNQPPLPPLPAGNQPSSPVEPKAPVSYLPRELETKVSKDHVLNMAWLSHEIFLIANMEGLKKSDKKVDAIVTKLNTSLAEAKELKSAEKFQASIAALEQFSKDFDSLPEKTKKKAIAIKTKVDETVQKGRARSGVENKSDQGEEPEIVRFHRQR